MRSHRPDLRVEPLSSHHDLPSFTCGDESLDRYLKTQAGQDVRRKANGVFILVECHAHEHVLGYYSLCATALQQGEVPLQARKHVPRYPLVSATLLGRMAIAANRQGERLGSILLADALKRTLSSASTVGSCMLVVDAISERAAGFYEANGFIRLPESLRLVLPMRTIDAMIEAPG
jgi:GNAT superfamily N-acetyltransferase